MKNSKKSKKIASWGFGSSKRSDDTNRIAKEFSKLTTSSTIKIISAYQLSTFYFQNNINWIDLPKEIIPPYEFTKFDWLSRKDNKVDTQAASDHLLKELNLFLKMHNGSSLDSIFMKIKDVSSSSAYDVQLHGFDCWGRTDLIISSLFCDQELEKNYCNIQLKPVVKYKCEDSDEIYKSSDAEKEKLTGQPLAELLGSIYYSSTPIMQFTTDLDQNFHIMFLSTKNNVIKYNHYDLDGTEAIATLATWLLYFCPHIDSSDQLIPKTKDLKFLKSIQDANQHIKNKIQLNNFFIPIASQKLEIDSVVEEDFNGNSVFTYIYSQTEEDNRLKCQKWVDSLI